MVKATAEVNGKEYTIPMSYKDITLGKFKAIQGFLYSDYNKEKTEQIIEGKVKDEEEILNYMNDFINYVVGIPTKELKHIRRFTDEENIGIEDLFYSMSFLFTVPETDKPAPKETIGKYHFIDKIDLNQAILKDLDMIEYTEANSVIRVFNQLSAGEGKYNNLNLLMAIMYRPMVKDGWFSKPRIEDYDSEKVKERAKDFNDIDMQTVWDCLFFFISLKRESLKSIGKSLEAEGEKLPLDWKVITGTL